ncbi:hypothetical protein SEEM1594_15563 [Salmonella enterica subsp. enterica serovar Muenchen str. baa1594]|nr:hypothetical protein SEEM1594_15563 [Salmonella enterica subsp. enterica serovar Muenchen str. baa1594]
MSAFRQKLMNLTEPAGVVMRPLLRFLVDRRAR